MKKFAAVTILGSCLASAALAHQSAVASPNERRLTHSPAAGPQQIPVAMPGPPGGAGPKSGLIIADVLGRQSSISIFTGLVNDVESASARLQDKSANTTVLAPLNAELLKMARKPWEDPEDYAAFGASAYDGADGESRAQKNLRRFVEAHLVPQSPWTPDAKVTTLAGTSLTLEEDKDGKRVVQPDGVAVVDVADRVSNGQVWVVQGVLRPRS